MYEIWILVYFWGKYMYSVLCKLKQISEPTPSPPQKKWRNYKTYCYIKILCIIYSEIQQREKTLASSDIEFSL